jgi:short subunit dehydrogenase-like uncharacterized protein
MDAATVPLGSPAGLTPTFRFDSKVRHAGAITTPRLVGSTVTAWVVRFWRGIVLLVAVAVAVYLPSWHGRHQFNAAERNAVRLNQALRVLAETSETPQEVRLELNARTALAQQRLAKQAQTEREEAELARARAELAATTLLAKAEAAAARERAAATARGGGAPSCAVRARRRARLAATTVAVARRARRVGWGAARDGRLGPLAVDRRRPRRHGDGGPAPDVRRAAPDRRPHRGP